MNYYALSALINTLAAAVCGATIYLHNPKSTKNLFFALHVANFVMWSAFYVFWQLSSEARSALFLIRATMMFAILMPVLHLQYVLVLFDLLNPFRKKILLFAYGMTGVFLLSNFTPFFVAGVSPKMNFLFWPNPGIVFHAFVASFGLPILFSMYFICDLKSRASTLVKRKLAWVLIATLIGYVGVASNFPLWYDLKIPPFLNSTIIIYLIVASFLCFRLGLFDIRAFFQDTTVHIVTALLIGSVFSLIVSPFLEESLAIAFLLIMALTMPIVYRPLYKRIRDAINRTRLGGGHQYLNSVDDTMARIRESTYTYDDLARNMVRSLMNTFPIEMAAVYFFDFTKKELHLRAQEGMSNEMVKDLRFNRSALAVPESDPLMQYIEGRKDVVVREALGSQGEGIPFLQDVENSMERIEAEICAPFLFAGKVKGILAIGKKRANRMYNVEDLEAIYSFGRMGEEVMRYIMGMESELKLTALYAHDMDNDTKSLVQMLQYLQSPLSKKQPESRILKLIQQAEDIADRLNQTFRLNRDRSGLIMKSIRGDYEKTAIDILPVIRLSCGKFTLQAEKSEVSFDIRLPSEPALVLGNADDLVRVVDNLLANALRYVARGGRIDVRGEKQGDLFALQISDDGNGIKSEDIERIWEVGWQVKNAKQGASGIGLSIARQIVHLHSGTIVFESREETQGATFTVKLPLLVSPLAKSAANKSRLEG